MKLSQLAHVLRAASEISGYHADGVSPETAAMPAEWMDRARPHYFGDVTAIVPNIHDLAVSKCAAMRDKDADFVRALFREGHLKLDLLEERLALLDARKFNIPALLAWARRRAVKAGASR